jgi:hypothetical protein
MRDAHGQVRESSAREKGESGGDRPDNLRADVLPRLFAGSLQSGNIGGISGPFRQCSVIGNRQNNGNELVIGVKISSSGNVVFTAEIQQTHAFA